MRALFFSKETFVWVALAVLTCVAWLLADGYDPGSVENYQYFTIGIMVLAFFKVRLVVMHFMEIGSAPLPLRAVFEVWLVIVCVIVLSLYLTL